jgi:hypothetical protein
VGFHPPMNWWAIIKRLFGTATSTTHYYTTAR